MKSLIKNVLLLSVFGIVKSAAGWSMAKGRQSTTRQQTGPSKEEKSIKRKMLIASTVHTLLGIVYND